MSNKYKDSYVQGWYLVSRVLVQPFLNMHWGTVFLKSKQFHYFRFYIQHIGYHTEYNNTNALAVIGIQKCCIRLLKLYC